VLLGVAICAFAGRARERALHLATATPGKGNAGLILALLCGLGASFVNFGLTFGAPLIDSAKTLGASPLMAANAVWLPLMAAGAIPNLAYCAYLIKKNHSRGRFAGGGAGHWTLAFVMAVFWFGSTLLYGAAAERLGSLGPILGWPLFMSLIVITASLLGIFTGEWKGTGKPPLATQLAGVTVLVAAVFLLAHASQLVS
jgi:L-rhamnose-H+ transport protein